MSEKKIKILVAEDDPNLGMLLTQYLEAKDFEVTLCKDGQQGFEAFKQDQYDILILDVMMPIMDGFTLASEIRSTDKDVPIIFLTAKTLKDDVLKGFEVGADDYLTKPFTMEVLVARINAILRRSGVAEENFPKDFPISS